MLGQGRVRALRNLISHFGTRRTSVLAPDTDAANHLNGVVFPSRVLRNFLAKLRGRDAPVLLDLGPVVGANVSFLGEQLGCKLIVNDLLDDLDCLTREGGDVDNVAFLRSRFALDDGSVDGVLCWDWLDYVDKAAARVLSRELARVLRPGGVLFVCFGTKLSTDRGYTKYEIVNESSLRHLFYSGTQSKVRVLQSREITELFDRLTVTESFLLANRMREMLFRKPSTRTTIVD